MLSHRLDVPFFRLALLCMSCLWNVDTTTDIPDVLSFNLRLYLGTSRLGKLCVGMIVDPELAQ
jgi:hypothetical protein